MRLPGIEGLRALAATAILLVVALVLETAGVRGGDGRLVAGALHDPVELAQAALLLQGYTPETILVAIGPAWSLAVEAVFYLVLPVLALAAAAAARRTATRSGRVRVLLGPPLLLLAVGLSGTLVAGIALDARPAVAAGLVSYSVFLWHAPVVQWLEPHELTEPGWSGFAFDPAITAAAVAILSVLTYRLVERPALRRKRPSSVAEARMAGAQAEAAP